MFVCQMCLFQFGSQVLIVPTHEALVVGTCKGSFPVVCFLEAIATSTSQLMCSEKQNMCF